MNKVNFKKLFCLITICMVVFIAFPSNGISASTTQKPIELKLAHSYPQQHILGKGAAEFKELVEKDTNGKVVIQIYPADTFATLAKTLDELMRGTLDMHLMTPAGGQNQIKELAALMQLFAFDDIDHINRFWSGPALKRVQQIYAKRGVIVHSPASYGFRQMSNNVRPIQTAADVKGLKMRVPPEIQILEMYKSLGAVPTTIAFTEVYMGLSQNLADGACGPMESFMQLKWNEVQKYVSITNHCYQAMFLQINKAKWDSLSPDVQKVIEKADEVVMAKIRKGMVESDKANIKAAQDKGVKVNYLTDAGRKTFQEATKSAYAPIAKFAGEEWFNEVLGYVEASRKK